MSIYSDLRFALELDLDNSGSFATDISDYLYEVADISEGRHSALEAFGGTTVSLVLDNSDSRFSPRNAAGPYYPDLKLWKPARVRAQITNLAAITNLCDNPSAEIDLGGYSVSANCSKEQDTTVARFGKASAKFTHNSVGNLIVTIEEKDDTPFTPTAGLDYSAIIHVRHDDTGHAPASPLLRIGWYNAGSELISYSSVVLTKWGVGEGWLRGHVTDTAPVGTVMAQIKLFTGVAFTKHVWVDGVMFYQGATEEPYCDGSQPGCSWSGTAHASTSSRPANPYFGFCLGRIGGINVRRDHGVDERCTLAIVSESLFWRREQINMAPITGPVKGHLVLERIFDKLSGQLGDVIESSFSDYYQAPGTPDELSQWSVIGTVEKATVRQGVSPEGPVSVRVLYAAGNQAGDGMKRPVTPDVGTNYDIVIYVRSESALGQHKLRIAHDGDSEIASALFTPGAALARVELYDVAWTTGANPRIEIVSTQIEGTSYNYLLSAYHIQKSSLRVKRRIDGETYDVLWHQGYQRSARALLNEVAASAGGWLRQEVDDSPATSQQMVFEDINNRLATPIPIARFTDNTELDGLPFDSLMCDESMGDLYAIFRVGSLGEVKDIGAAGAESVELWRLEPAGLSFAANEEKRLYFRHILMGDTRRHTDTWDWSAGSHAKFHVFDYGVGGYIDIKKDSTPGTLDMLVLKGVGKERASERTFTEVDKRTDPEDEPARIMEIDMLGQGRLTTAMTAVRDWFADRYYHGKPILELDASVGDAEQLLIAVGLRISDPVRIRHGNYGLNDDYYVEGRSIRMEAGGMLSISLFLDAA